MIQVKVSPVKPAVLGVMMLVAAVGVCSVLIIDPADPYFRWTTLLLPAFFASCGLVVLTLAARYATRPLLSADEQEVRFGILRQQKIARSDLGGVAYDGRRMVFRKLDGTTIKFSPPLHGVDLAKIARDVNRWAGR